MNPQLLFVVGTALSWAGWICALRAIYLGGMLVLGAKSLEASRLQKGLIGCAVGAALSFGVVSALHMPPSTTWRLPLVWFVMPFVAWTAVLGVGVILLRAVQLILAVDAQEKRRRLMSMISWSVVVLACVFLYRRDPTNKIEVFTGGVPMPPETAVTVLLLAVASVLAMVLSVKSAKARGVTRTLFSQIALIAGSVVFGLPFAFLVITSFKEDRDMSSPNGIVWIPRVQETVAYDDTKNPWFETTHNGQQMTVAITEKRPDGSASVEIQKPASALGTTFDTQLSALKEVPKQENLVTVKMDGQTVRGMVIENLDDGRERVQAISPDNLKGRTQLYQPQDAEPIRNIGLKWSNYPEALSYLPAEADGGLTYLKNTLILVVLSVIGTILSSSIVAYAFSRMKFPGRDVLFILLLSTMMLPAAVTMLPQFLIFRSMGWIDTLYPLWVPAFFASAFNVFLLRQFFKQIPMELEDASKIDGASYIKTFWSVMLPQIKPALAVIAIWTFMGAWNNFMGPLIYINSPEHMPLSYALQLFNSDRSGEPGLLMAFATLTIIPVLLLFFFAQRYFIEGVTLSGLGGR